MKIDPDQSRYHERPDARNEYSETEIKRLRLILRRLRFLEHQVRVNGGLANGGGSGGAAFADWEMDALAWLLKEVEYLPDQDKSIRPQVSRNTHRKGA